jgi:hypothetical protein
VGKDKHSQCDEPKEASTEYYGWSKEECFNYLLTEYLDERKGLKESENTACSRELQAVGLGYLEGE